MKKRLLLTAAALIVSFPCMARADLPDFQFKVLDPVPPSRPFLVDGSTPFAVQFLPCPQSVNATGCFYAYNNSKLTFTSIDVTFTNSTDPSDPQNFTDFLNSQPATCVTTPGFPTDPQGSLFSSANCGLSQDGMEYFLELSGGSGITPGETFILTETGPDPEAFGVGTAVLGTAPEPSSIWMALSASGGLGYLLRRRRRADMHA